MMKNMVGEVLNSSYNNEPEEKMLENVEASS